MEHKVKKFGNTNTKQQQQKKKKKVKPFKKKLSGRKQMRKAQRAEKKAKKHEYLLAKTHASAPAPTDKKKKKATTTAGEKDSGPGKAPNKKKLQSPGPGKKPALSKGKVAAKVTPRVGAVVGSAKKPRMSTTLSYKSFTDKLALEKKQAEDALITKLEQKYGGGRYSSSESESEGSDQSEHEHEHEHYGEGSGSSSSTNGGGFGSDTETHWDKHMTLEQLREKTAKTRKKRLLEENEAEDKYIQSLSKKLKLNKKAIIAESFRTDGLDYLLELCDTKKKKSGVDDEEVETETSAYLKEKRQKKLEEEAKKDKGGKQNKGGGKGLAQTKGQSDSDSEVMEDEEDDFSGGDEDESDLDLSGDGDEEDDEDSVGGEEEEQEEENPVAGSDGGSEDGKDEEESLTGDDEDSEESEGGEEEEEFEQKQPKPKKGKTAKTVAAAAAADEDVWEDIYGRLRDKDGNVLAAAAETSAVINTGKYIPPAKRAAGGATGQKLTKSDSTTQQEQQQRSKSRALIERQLKGLINRLTETNMQKIATEIEGLYMGSSRNEMNESMLELFYVALVKNVQQPERVILEHVMLIAVLHANIGTEIGAFFIQSFVQKFHETYSLMEEEIKECGSSGLEETKELENLMLLSCFMYHFKIVDSSLIYDLLHFVTQSFTPKDIELILTVLRSIGFRLRKDDPRKLKELILLIQKRGSETKSEESSSRVKFMLEILLAIRNNNMSKIPNYDPDFGEHLLKTMKVYFRKGAYVSELKISMQDLLTADAKGRWWIVGSAWSNMTPVAGSGHKSGPGEDCASVPVPVLNEKLLAKAKAQGMNTDVRKNIFCILMSAEDYVDAFEKLMHLGLKNQLEREIIHVAIYCALQEKKYNPYYNFLLAKLAKVDRRFMLTIQYSLWDRLKDLESQPKAQLKNLTQLLVFLINEKILPITALKIIDFTDMDELKLEILRGVLSGILLQENVQNLQEIFIKLGSSAKFSLFRESLKLFLLHFMLKNQGKGQGEGQGQGSSSSSCSKGLNLGPKELSLLKERVTLVDKIMMTIGHGRVQL